eukprot:2304365-Amphidinium_carterae.1
MTKRQEPMRSLQGRKLLGSELTSSAMAKLSNNPIVRRVSKRVTTLARQARELPSAGAVMI